jgi:hypothetical protein
MEGDPHKQITILKELAIEGVEYTPVDPERSVEKWIPVTIGNSRRLVGPLQGIDGIGPVSVRDILKSRKDGSPLKESIAKKLQNPRTRIDSLFPIADAIRRLHPDLVSSQVLMPETRPVNIIDIESNKGARVVVLCLISKINPSDENSEVKLAKRNGRRIVGPSMALNLFVRDDTDEVLCRVHYRDYERLGKPIVERAGAGKALYAIMGDVMDVNFKMIWIRGAKYLGSIGDDLLSDESLGAAKSVAAAPDADAAEEA